MRVHPTARPHLYHISPLLLLIGVHPRWCTNARLMRPLPQTRPPRRRDAPRSIRHPPDCELVSDQRHIVNPVTTEPSEEVPG